MITLKSFIKKEFLQALRDPRMKILIFGVPVIQLLIFGFALTNEVKNIELSCHFNPLDTLARDLCRNAYASGWFIPAPTTGEDPYQQIQSKEAEAVLIMPTEGLSKSIERQNGQVQLLINASNVLRARGIELYVKNLLADLNKREIVPRQNVPILHQQNIQFSVRVLYNPTTESAIFMVPGVIGMIVCLLSIVLTSMSLTKEKEQGTFEMLIASPIKTWELIMGKTIPYFILGMINIPLILAAGILIFGVPVRGAIWALALTSIVFLMTTVSIGLLISTFAKNQQQGMLGGFIFLFPAIMFSGVMFPIENMPPALKIFAYLDPIMYFAALLRNILLKGGNNQFV
ncbi:MAG: ABC transporter permease, partial [Pseudomonadota bacterium]